MKKFVLHLQVFVTSLIAIVALQTIPLGISNTLVYYFSPDLAGTDMVWRLALIFLLTYGGVILMIADYVCYIRYLFKSNEKLAFAIQTLSALVILVIMFALFWWHIDFDWIFQNL